MGTFTNNIVVEIFPDSNLPYGIYREFEFHSGSPDSGLLLKGREGFRFNGTSIPWGFRWLISPSDPELLQCAGGHDQIFNDGYLVIRVNGIEKKVPVHRDIANAFMSEMMIARKVKRWKRMLINPALAIGSGPAWKKSGENGAMRTDTTR